MSNPGETDSVNLDLFHGTREEAAAIIECHQAYLTASSNRLDAEALKRAWNPHPSCLFFHSAGYILRGLSDWLRLWDHARPRLKTSSPWRSFDLHLIGDGTMAVVVASRSTGFVINGEETTWLSRSTEVFTKDNGRWMCSHIHVSNAAKNPEISYNDIEKTLTPSATDR